MAIKKCPNCQRSHSANVLWCPCGYVFGREVEGSAKPSAESSAPRAAMPAVASSPTAETPTTDPDRLRNAVRNELGRGTSREAVITALVKRGLPEFEARVMVNEVARQTTPPKGAALSARPGRSPAAAMIGGCALFLAGALVTVLSVTLSDSGGGVLCYGAMIVGAVTFIGGLIGMLRGKRDV